MNFENAQPGVDGVDEANIACQFVEESDAAKAQTMDAFGHLIVEIAAGEDGPRLLGKLSLVETALDFALAGGQLSA
jgi:hypothetical protein